MSKGVKILSMIILIELSVRGIHKDDEEISKIETFYNMKNLQFITKIKINIFQFHSNFSSFLNSLLLNSFTIKFIK
jgi:hypothetical protein